MAFNGAEPVRARTIELVDHYPQDIELTVEQSHRAVRAGCSAAVSIDVDGAERLVVVAEADPYWNIADSPPAAAPVDGQLQRISLQAGDLVAANTIIARIQPIQPRPLDARSRAEARAAVEVARAAVARAEAAAQEAGVAVEHADSELARSQRLAQVTRGLFEGDVVIAQPTDTVMNGTRVRG